MSKSIYIYGASGHGKVVADIARLNGYEDIIFIDDGENEYPSFKDIKNTKHIPIAFGIGTNTIRKKLFEKVSEFEFEIISLVHPSAIVSSNVTIDVGTVVMPNVVINTNSTIGCGVILNSSSVIEHENIIKDFVHISPNVALAGEVTIKDNSHIGIGSNIIQGITVGENCIIGAGSIVIRDIENNKLCFGNPCKVIKEIK